MAIGRRNISLGRRRNGLGTIGGDLFQGIADIYGMPLLATSVRLLTNTYSGGLVRGRANDGAIDYGQADIMPYKVGNNYQIDLNSTLENLDATALGRGLTTSDTLADLLDVGGSNYHCNIPEWFGQDGVSTTTQTTASLQPLLASSGVLITENGLPSIQFDGNYLQTNLVDDITGNFSEILVAKSISTDVFSGIISSANAGYLGTRNNGVDWGTFDGSTRVYGSVTGGLQIVQRYSDGTIYPYVDGVAGTTYTSTQTVNQILIGTFTTTPTGIMNGYLSELMIYDANKINDQTAMYNSIKSTFGTP